MPGGSKFSCDFQQLLKHKLSITRKKYCQLYKLLLYLVIVKWMIKKTFHQNGTQLKLTFEVLCSNTHKLGLQYILYTMHSESKYILKIIYSQNEKSMMYVFYF